MIKANELRIGNLVSNDRSTCEILHLNGGDFINCTLKTKQGNPINAHYDLIEPIPLTEEWLLKAGFRKSKLEGYEVHFIYQHQKIHSGVTAIYNADFSMKLDNVARGIKYVHKLQNLYFALTGEELVFSLD